MNEWKMSDAPEPAHRVQSRDSQPRPPHEEVLVVVAGLLDSVVHAPGDLFGRQPLRLRASDNNNNNNNNNSTKRQTTKSAQPPEPPNWH